MISVRRILSSSTRSVLGLVLDGRRIHAAVVQSGPDGPSAGPSTSVEFDAGAIDPETRGRVLREALAKAGIRAREAVLGLPAEAILSVSSPAPALGAADLASLLQLEAEKGFPCDLAELQRWVPPAPAGAAARITQFAVRTGPLEENLRMLQAAGLRTRSVTATVAPLVRQAGEGDAFVVLRPGVAEVLVAVGDHPVVLRPLPADEGGRLRELRITLESLAHVGSGPVRRLRLVGDPASANALARGLNASGAIGDVACAVEAVEPSALAVALATAVLSGSTAGPEFLPPRPNRWRRRLGHHPSRRATILGGAVAAVVLVAAGTFLWREYRVWSRQREWNAIGPRVADLETIHARIREFRPWHDTTFPTLAALRLVTEVFPETGVVTAKAIEIRGTSQITVSGTTRDNAALLASLDRLRQRPGVANLKIEQIRGRAPAQFTFTFQLTRNGS